VNISDLIQSLGAKKSGSGYMALCPCHNDKNPSLSLAEKNGKVLFKCMAGCSQEILIEEFKSRGLWDGKQEQSKNQKAKLNLNDLTSIAVQYHTSLNPFNSDFLQNERYLSEEVIRDFLIGNSRERLTIPVFDDAGGVPDIRRYLPIHMRKKGDQKILPEPGGDGSAKLFPIQILKWIQSKLASDFNPNCDGLGNLKSHDLPKYVVLCEGELDALALISNGIPCITNTCGANAWTSSFSERIAQLKIPVVILMDNDPAGESGAVERARSLKSTGVEVYLCSWPRDRFEGHDVTDELKLFGLASLLEIIDQRVEYSDITRLSNVKAEKVNWLFEPYIAIGKVMIVEGQPGQGKTFMSLAIASAVTIGGRGLPGDIEFEPGIVLLMSAEDGVADTIKPRVDTMEANQHSIIIPNELFTLDEAGFRDLEKLVRDHKPRLVIIDPMMPFLKAGADSNKATDMRPFFRSLSRLAEKYGCAIVVTRHLAKSKDQDGVAKGLGSIDIAAAVRSILQVSQDPKDLTLKSVNHIKSNIGPLGKSLLFRIKDNRFFWEGFVNNAPGESAIEREPQRKIDEACGFLREILKSGPVPKDMILQRKSTFVSEATLNRAKEELKVKSIKVGGGEHQHWVWMLPNHEESRQTSFSPGDSDSHENKCESEESV